MRGIISILSAVAWSVFLYIGVDLCNGVAERKVPGYPSTGKLEYYVYFPAAMLTLSVCLTIFVNRTPKPAFFFICLSQLLLMFPFLVRYGGGV